MARVLTGIQSSGIPHLGNLLGAIKPAIELSKNGNNDSLFFIADFHSLTTIRDPKLLQENIYSTAAAWLAFGLDTEKTIFYKQSDVPEVCELAWILNCHTPIPMLENAHSYKDKATKLSKDKISAGLFTYPVLMAADILLFNSELVPVGKDQKQHLEITRDIARSFNHSYGETFTIPEDYINDSVMVIPGIDGQKMSKSYNNTINIFLEDKALLKNIKKIETDSLPLEAPKNPDTCNVFKIYSLIGSKEQIESIRSKYEGGNFGYGHAKQELFELIKIVFQDEREKYFSLINEPTLIDEALQIGADKARVIAREVLSTVRNRIGLTK